MIDDIQVKCLKKWFYKVLPALIRNSNHPLLKKMFSSNIQFLGIEKALEELIALYKKEIIMVTCFDENNFIVVGFFEEENTIALLYKEENGVEILD